jgi:hypothetical protein
MRCESCIHSYHQGSDQLCNAMDTGEEYGMSADDMADYQDEPMDVCPWFKPVIVADDTPFFLCMGMPLDEDEFQGSYEDQYEEECEYTYDPTGEEVYS